MNKFYKETHIDQADYIRTLKPNDISKERKSDRSSKLDQNELYSLRTVIGQSGWITVQARLDLAFEICMLSSNSKNATANEIIQANKILEKLREKMYFLDSVSEATSRTLW